MSRVFLPLNYRGVNCVAIILSATSQLRPQERAGLEPPIDPKGALPFKLSFLNTRLRAFTNLVATPWVEHGTLTL